MIDKPENYADFYAGLYELFHHRKNRASAGQYLAEAVRTHPDWLSNLKAVHAYVAQVVAVRTLQCDNGVAATYTMLQSLLPELRDGRQSV